MTALKEEFLLNSWESGREVGRREMAKEIIEAIPDGGYFLACDYTTYPSTLPVSSLIDLKAQLRAKYLNENL